MLKFKPLQTICDWMDSEMQSHVIYSQHITETTCFLAIFYEYVCTYDLVLPSITVAFLGCSCVTSVEAVEDGKRNENTENKRIIPSSQCLTPA